MTMAAAGLAGLGTALMGGIKSKPVGQDRPARQDTSTTAIALAPTPRAARAAARNADKERVMAILTDPAVIGVLALVGGVALASNMPYHANEKTTARLRGITAAGVVLMALGRAGVGDLTTLTLAGGAGAALGLGNGNLVDEFKDVLTGGGGGGGGGDASDQSVWDRIKDLVAGPLAGVPLTIYNIPGLLSSG